MAILHADLGRTRTEEQLRADARWVEDRTARLLAGGISGAPAPRELLAAVREAGLRDRAGDDDAAPAGRHRPRASSGDLGGDPFDVTICGDEVPARKPDPAPYLQAMAALGVDAGGVRRHRGLARRRRRRPRRRCRGPRRAGMQPVAAGARARLRDGLAGVGVAELAAVLADVALADVPA